MTQSSKILYRRTNSIEVGEIHRNVSQELIEITEDKLKLLLSEYLSCMESRSSWHTPLALLITIVLVLTTTDFKFALGVAPDTWSAIFIMSSVLCCIWLIKSLFNLSKKMTIQALLNKIKNKQDV